MLNFSEQKQILKYKDHGLVELLEDNLKSELPTTVKVAAYVTSSDPSFLRGVGGDITSKLHAEPPFIRAFFVENIKKKPFSDLHFKEMLQLIYFFKFTKKSIRKATTCVILETQYHPYTFLSEIVKYDISFIISKIKSDISCCKFKEHLFNMAKRSDKLDLLFSSKFFYLDGFELQSFGVPERYVIYYIENMENPRIEVDKMAFESILKRFI